MSYNGAGTFTINSSGQPVVLSTTISDTVFNALTADLATGLSTAITKDGQTATTVRIPFAAGINSTLATDATSTSTGSILTAGGLGVTKAAWIGGLLNVAGATTLQSTLTTTGDITVGGDNLYFGGATSAHVQLKRSSTVLEVKLGDDSAYANLYTYSVVNTSGIAYLGGASSSDVRLQRSAAVLQVKLGDDTAYANVYASSFIATAGILYLNGAAATDVRLQRSGTILEVKLGDNSAYTNIYASSLVATNGSVLLAGSTSSEVGLFRVLQTVRVRLADDSAYADLEAANGFLSGSAGLRFVGTAANDVRINKNGNFTLRVQKGDGSGSGNLQAAAISGDTLAAANGFTGAGAYTSFVFSAGICTSAS